LSGTLRVEEIGEKLLIFWFFAGFWEFRFRRVDDIFILAHAGTVCFIQLG
jgi:hypothetical protein